MWAIALCHHPKSDLYNTPDKDIRVFDMVKDKSFKLDDYKEHIELFKEMSLLYNKIFTHNYQFLSRY